MLVKARVKPCTNYHCKVEFHDKKLVVVGRWVLAYIQVAIKSLKLVSCIDVIVVVEHRHCETLAKTARADKEEVAIGVLNLLNKSSLIDIVIVVFANCHEVHHAVGNAQWLAFYAIFIHIVSFLSFHLPVV